MVNLIIRVISGIFIGIAWIIWFIFNHIIKWFGTLIQQLTIKFWIALLWLLSLSYIISYI